MKKIRNSLYISKYKLALFLVYSSAVFSLYLTYPGAAYTDTLIQFRDVLSGSYGDWQVPIMTGWWSLLQKAFPWAPQNLFIFQLTVFLCAFHLLIAYFKEKPWVGLSFTLFCLNICKSNSASVANDLLI